MPEPNTGRRSTKRRAANITADQVIADQVRWLRNQRGISQQELADSLGWTQSQIARLELGRRAVTVADLLALCWALDVAPVYVLSGSLHESGDIPITERLRVSPGHVKEWIRGGEPLAGSNYRRYFENIPDDEWIAAYGEVAQQRRQAAEHFERAEEALVSGTADEPTGARASTYSPEHLAELAEERRQRRNELAAASRTRKKKSGG